jgi:hypothetical protein
MAAYTFLAVKRMNRENHASLSLQVLAQRGEDKEIKKQMEQWEKDS